MDQIEQAVICALDPHVDPNLKAQVSKVGVIIDCGIGWDNQERVIMMLLGVV